MYRFSDGKVSKTLILIDRLEMQRQLSNPDARYTPKLITEKNLPRGSLDGRLSARGLESTYRAAVNSINRQTMDTDLHKFCSPACGPQHQDSNGRGLPASDTGSLHSNPNLVVRLSALPTAVVDERTRTQQRAVRIALIGKPIATLAGVKP
ncbi:hypothetical protein Daesc_005731 [Daldinia eschscholtzii]|uniref:Uncharacterized protein n=1 Tax=Daldinia eschscholtzii TaxID=292717 RepID=A0AAX6MLZ9_9PEZI